MKLAKKITDIQLPSESYNSFIRRVIYAVKDDYDFVTNQADDITTQQNALIAYRLNMIDAILYKSILKQYFLPNWALLTTEEKRELISVLVYPAATDLRPFCTLEEEIMWTREFGSITRSAREFRWDTARLKMIHGLTEMESLSFYTDTKPYKDDYLDANIPSLILWLSNGSYPPLGIDFTTNGFAQKSYYTLDRKNTCLDVLQHGLF